MHEGVEGKRDGALRIIATNSAKITANRMLTEQAVRTARREGASWAQVGAALGISREGAWRHYRYVEKDPQLFEEVTMSEQTTPIPEGEEIPVGEPDLEDDGEKHEEEKAPVEDSSTEEDVPTDPAPIFPGTEQEEGR